MRATTAEFSKVPEITLVFWIIKIAATTLGETGGDTVGDFLDKPMNQGGLALSRPLASAVIAAVIIGCLVTLRQKAGRHPGALDQLQKS